MNQVERDFQYPMWRFHMWTNGYGNYNCIDIAAKDGTLEVGKDYPPTTTHTCEWCENKEEGE